MFEDDEWVALIKKLITLTRNQKISWALSESDLLLSKIGDAAYTVSSVDGDGRAPYQFAVLTGAEDEYTEVARIESGPEDSRIYTPAEAVSDLQRIAYRMARGGPQLAAKLLADLEAIEPTPPSTPAWKPATISSEWGQDTPF